MIMKTSQMQTSLGGEIRCLRTVYVHTLFDLVNFVLFLWIFMELVYPKVL